MKGVELTEKERLFVDEYLVDLNATQAVIRAGYQTRNAKQLGNSMRHKKHIAEQIDYALAERSRRTGINADRVIRELARLAFVNPDDVVDLLHAKVKDGAQADDTAAISSVKYKHSDTDTGSSTEREVKFADKTKALELLGKHLGMFTENVNVAMSGPVQIVDDIKGKASNGNG